MLSRNLAVDMLLVAVGVAAGVMAIGFGLWSAAGPGDGLFPLIVAGVAVLGAGASLVMDLRTLPAAGACIAESADLSPDAGIAKPIAYIAVMLALAIAIPFSGFYVAMACALLAILRPIEKMSWAASLGTTAVALIATHVLFERALGVRLPHGQLW